MKATLSIKLKSILFNICFIIISIFFSLLSVFTLPLPRIWTIRIAYSWSCSSLWLLKKICNLNYTIEGLENIPNGKNVIFASKHQSAWETIAYQKFFMPSVFMFKKELTFIPFFGIALLRSGSIPVNRGHGNKHMITDLTNKFKDRLKNFNIVIFPEGTRSLPNSTPNYKSGLSLITQDLKDSYVMPIAMNSGLYWPKHSFVKYPGTIRVKILPPIKTGINDRHEFQNQLITAIEKEMKNLNN